MPKIKKDVVYQLEEKEYVGNLIFQKDTFVIAIGPRNAGASVVKGTYTINGKKIIFHISESADESGSEEYVAEWFGEISEDEKSIIVTTEYDIQNRFILE